MTEWREVLGWEGLYAVSDDGQVKSLPRQSRQAERILAIQREQTPRAYWYATLWRGKVQHHARVHVLMLEAFVGTRPPGMFGLHNDDNPNHNYLANLRWGSRSENSADMVAHGNHNHARKTHCKWGHPFEGDNLIRTPRQRACRACARRRNAEYWARKQAYALAVYAADTATA